MGIRKAHFNRASQQSQNLLSSTIILISILTFLFIKESISVDIFVGPQEFCYTDPECNPDSNEWFGICHNGSQQSPIDLHRSNGRHSHYSFFPLEHMNADHFFLQNNGHTINLDFTPTGRGSSLFPGYGLSSTKYRFSNAHFHWGQTDLEGSEHKLEGQSFSMELHLVHFKDKYATIAKAISSGDPNALAVIGIFLQVSDTADPNIALKPIIDNLVQVHETHTFWVKVDDPLDLTPLVPKATEGTIYSYKGSLTTPGCNEQVNWYVFAEPAVIAPSDVQAFRNVVDGRGQPLYTNCRPVQNSSGRKIEIIKTV